MDGIDQWKALLGENLPPRKEILYNIDPMFEPNGNAGIRVIKVEKYIVLFIRNL